MRSVGRGQALVEFGIIALLFTLLMFAVVDFGLLLNDWLAVSSGSRALARDASVGMFQGDLESEAQALQVPGVTSQLCCDPIAGNGLWLSVVYYDQCTPGVGTCNPVAPIDLDNRFGNGSGEGQCDKWSLTPPTPCPHPAPPSAPGTCPPHSTCPGDSVVVTLTAAGAQVITPLVRPFFCPNSTALHCYVPVGSTLTMRWEGNIL